MGLWLEFARVAAAANVAVLLGLEWVWLGNYRDHGASHTLAYLVFAGFLLVENLLWLYFYLVHPAFIGWFLASTIEIRVGVTLLCGLELVALAVVARITLV